MMALLQTLLSLRRQGTQSIRFHGQDVPIELPAGYIGFSPYFDVTRSMPSVFANKALDYIPPPPESPEIKYYPIPIGRDHAWPSTPPRGDVYMNANCILHPLVSPLAAPKEIWQGAPPVFIAVGEEALTDETCIMGRRMHQVGVPVSVEQFEGAPHCYPLLNLSSPISIRTFGSVAAFVHDVFAGRSPATGCITSFRNLMRTIKPIPLEKAEVLDDTTVSERLHNSYLQRMEVEDQLLSSFAEKAKL